MKSSVANKKDKAPLFQVLLIKNDPNEDVEVHEADEVNFLQVKQHLQNGGSVFITSKESQKQPIPKTKGQLNYTKSRRNLGFALQQCLRSS